MRGIRATLALMAAVSAPLARADGMLDPGFGTGGRVVTGFPGGFSTDEALSLAILPDGRIVAAGSTHVNLPNMYMAVARYLPTGALDPSFDGDGMVELPFLAPPPNPDSGAEAWATLPQPDGRIVIVGGAAGAPAWVFALARLNEDGSLDATFGTGGKVTTSFPGVSVGVRAGLLQPDGRIVAVGRSSGLGFVAVRYDANGTLDPTFGSGGRLIVPLSGSLEVNDVVRQPDGKLVVAGTMPSGPFLARDFALVRLLANGDLDPSFSGDGVVTADFGGIETGNSVIVLGDGRLVLAGSRGTELPNTVTDFAIARFLPDGALDTTFGTAGLALLDSGEPEYAAQIVELPNGNLMLAGTTSSGGVSVDFILTRLLPGGTLDTSFGTDGFLRTDFTGGDTCNALVIAGPDRLLAAGSTGAFPADFGLARYIATTPVALQEFSVE
ncbi:MAG: delta-60 repeat domain-containing protein [Vicinamibacteria bacterium]